MDFRPLTDAEIAERCCLNMTETYFALGRGAQTLQLIQREGIIGLTSASGHPVSNFAFVGRTTLETIQQLRWEPFAHKLNYYVLPTSDSELIVSMMVQHGFVLANRLNLMFLVKAPAVGSRLHIERVEGDEDRTNFVRYLASLFWGGSSAVPLDELSVRTASAEACELLRIGERHSPTGGAMRTRFGDTVGLYNIAIASEFRHRGIGSSLVGQLAREALARGEHVTLQCNSSLVPWYEKLGFRRVQEVKVLTLENDRN